MKRFVQFLAVAAMALLYVPMIMRAQSYDQMWKEVTEAERKSLPQSARQAADNIFQKAVKEKQAGQMFKAYLYREHQQERLTPDSLYTRYAEMEQWARTETDPVNRAILHSLLAEMYADYLQGNSYALRQRTNLDDDVPEDIREWTANLFIQKIDEHAQASLQPQNVLLKTDNGQYVPLVIQEEGSAYFGHDLYHLLAKRAMDVYAGIQQEEGEELKNERTAAIHQALVRAYERTRPDAVVLAYLDYWQWRKGQGEEAPLSELDDLIRRYGSSPLCAEVFLAKAEQLRGEGKYKEADQTCDEAVKRYSDYRRINALKNLKSELYAPSSNLTFARYVYPTETWKLDVSYSNLRGITVYVYAATLSNIPERYEAEKISYANLPLLYSRHFEFAEAALLNKEPILGKDTTLTMPALEKNGVYVLRVEADNQPKMAQMDYFATTRLKLVSLDLGGQQYEFTTIDSHTGHPVGGVTVALCNGNGSYRKEVASLTTGADGKATYQLKNNERVNNYSLRKDDDKALTYQYLNLYSYYTRTEDTETLHGTLLTDRSLYRPGQTIYIKGVLYRQKGRDVRVAEGVKDELVLRDVNHQEVARRQVLTGDFGSFTTEFVLPTACLNGNFTIEMQQHHFSTNVRVEEYKRPTFEITFNDVEEAYRLGDEVKLTGNARMLNGVSLQNVPVRYTIVRSENSWYRWTGREKPLQADSVLIDKDGRFTIPVKLTPDERRMDRNFTYFIRVTVTDVSGETQEAETRIGAFPTAYQLYFHVDGMLRKEGDSRYQAEVYNTAGVEQLLPVRYRLFRLQKAADGLDSEEQVAEGTLNAFEETDFSAWKSLSSGKYTIRLSLPQEDGLAAEQRAQGESTFLLYAETDSRLGYFTDIFCPKYSLEFSEGETAAVCLGTSHHDAYVFLDIFNKDKRLESRVLSLDDEIITLSFPYREEYGDGVTLYFFFVKEGVAHSTNVTLRKRQPDRRLRLKWDVFRDKLFPGQTEEWRLTISDAQAQAVSAELLALMYDASLDKIYQRGQDFYVSYPYYYRYVNKNYTSYPSGGLYLEKQIERLRVAGLLDYDRFFHLSNYYGGTRMYANGRVLMGTSMVAKSMALEDGMVMETAAPMAMEEAAEADIDVREEEAGGTLEAASADVRTNFAETAFFYPQLRTNEQGEVVISFTIPESLTRWRFMGYAHTQDMLTGSIEAEATTSKDFMLRPNMPRFLRVGDETQIAASIQNVSEKNADGEVSFILFNPLTEQVYSTQKAAFSVKAGETGSVNFGFTVPEGIDLMGIRMVADAADFSDGEQHVLAVLSNKQYVVESVAMPIRGRQTRTFDISRLFNHHASSATQRRLTVEFTGNPAWYAVQALPSVSMPVRDNAIDWAIAYYVNALATYIANSQPRIQQVLNYWKNTAAGKETFLSQLQKNADLKEILLSESPWVLDARSETEQRERILTLFDLNQMKDKLSSSLVKLQGLQNEDGGWSWYKGMRSSWYTTTFIVEQLTRVILLTGESLSAQSSQMRQKAFGYLHAEALDYYREVQRMMKRNKNYRYDYLSSAMMDYLYLIALSGEAVPSENKEAYDFFMERVPNNLTFGSLTTKAMSAVILKRAGQAAKAQEFVASLKEHLVMEDELGAHFAFLDSPYAWGMMPMPTHVAVMEAFGEFEGNESLIEEMKIWLLKQKQTHGWNNSVATADAVYALLCTGANLLENQGDVRVSVGNEVVETLAPAKTTVPELGYVKQVFDEGGSLAATEATVEKRDDGIAWGAVYAQYLSPMTDVAQQGAELNVSRKFYVERTDAKGRKSLVEVGDKARLKVGDMVVSRITVSLDRSMDFLQLKDRLAACFEPLNALSGYRWNQGIGYYVESEDAATNFFFDGLGKGVYVLESRYRVSRAGTYQVGLASMQCAYAPEFTSHSSGIVVVVDE